jgi:hypothetical protein
MAKLTPVKIEGASVTFGAYLDNGEFFTQTWTHTDEDGVPQNVKDVTSYCSEFQMLVNEQEGRAPSKPDEYATGAKYADATTGEPLTAKQAKDAYDAVTPKEKEDGSSEDIA